MPHTISHGAKPNDTDRTAAAVINVRLDASENMRSRRAGTSIECRSCTHRNSSASGIWISDADAPLRRTRAESRKLMNAISRAKASTTFSQNRSLWRGRAGATKAGGDPAEARHPERRPAHTLVEDGAGRGEDSDQHGDAQGDRVLGR